MTKKCFGEMREYKECAACEDAGACSAAKNDNITFIDTCLDIILYQDIAASSSVSFAPKPFFDENYDAAAEAFFSVAENRRPKPVKRHGDPDVDIGNVVTSEQVLSMKQYQQRALNVPWPDVFHMESGDYRFKARLEDRNKRHQIDWSRSGSYVEPMPNLRSATLYGNPYEGVVGTSSVIAFKTFEAMRRRPGVIVKPADIFTEVGATTSYDRCSVRDALRDCALFGLLLRFKFGPENFGFAIK